MFTSFIDVLLFLSTLLLLTFHELNFLLCLCLKKKKYCSQEDKSSKVKCFLFIPSERQVLIQSLTRTLLIHLFFVVSVLLQPLRVNGVKVYTENVDKRQIIMDMQIRYAANVSHSQTLDLSPEQL